MKRVAAIIVLHNNRILNLQYSPIENGTRCFDWTLPCGKMEDGEPILNGANRELEEETGLSYELDNSHRFLTYVVGEYEITVFVFLIEELPEIFLSEEHIGYGWFTIPEMLHMISMLAPFFQDARFLQLLNQINATLEKK